MYNFTDGFLSIIATCDRGQETRAARIGDELQAFVDVRYRHGTFVVDEPPHSEPLQECRERVAAAADRFIFELRMLGVGLDDLSVVQGPTGRPGVELRILGVGLDDALEAAKAADRRHDAETHDAKTKAAPAQ
ncbi:MAG: hypothetical protein OXN44_11245 [Acidimicrobiaceae bacterium]|nr:hypothetical protein [Acidimicrobiaceae bacterium]